MSFYRVFFWFSGADPEREGGPWWYCDFLADGTDPRSDNWRERHSEFVRDLAPFCHALLSVRYERGKFPGKLDPMSIAPPLHDYTGPPFDSIVWHVNPGSARRKA